MFNDSKVFSSFSVDDVPKAKQFYEEVLGLETEDKMGGLQVKFNGGPNLFIYPKPNHAPASFTVLNFMIKDVEEAVKKLKDAGISLEHYDDLTNEDGIADDPEKGPKIAWFKDPAGNILSVIQES
jgi:catechol 2,3-dioxygenase-like lactoylglutathione lyase family enzyme